MYSFIKINSLHLRIVGIIIISSMLGFATKYSGEFQELIVGGRICGMGGTGIAQGNDPSSSILNPALSSLIHKSIYLMHSENFSGIVKNDFGGLIIPKENSAYGICLQMVSVNDIRLTNLPDTTQQPNDGNRPFPYDTVSTRDMVFYLNAARLKGILAYGINLKVYYRNLAVIYGWGGGVDIGMKLDLKNLDVGISMRDFVLAPIYWENKTKEYISPKVSFGVASKIPITKLNLMFIVESDIVRDISLNEFLLYNGIELVYHNKISGRLGRNGSRYTAGIGFRYKKLFFDYGLITHQDLGISNKLSVGVEF